MNRTTNYLRAIRLDLNDVSYEIYEFTGMQGISKSPNIYDDLLDELKVVRSALANKLVYLARRNLDAGSILRMEGLL